MVQIDWSQLMITTLMGELSGQKDIEIDIDVCRNLFLRKLLEVKQKYGERFGDIVIARDGKDYWRRKEFQYYKFTRKQAKEDSGYDWKQITLCLNTILDEVEQCFPYPVVHTPIAEADDIIAILAEWSQTNDLDDESMFGGEPKDMLIVSSDEDFAQLQEYKNVKQISPITKKQVKPEIPLPHFCIEHVLVGDSIDSIPNILSPIDFFKIKSESPDKMRQKPVTASLKKFYYEQYDKFGDIIEFKTPEQEARYRENEKLVLFKHIPQHVKDAVLDSFKSQQGKDRSMIFEYLVKFKLKNLMDDYHDF